MKNKSAFYIKQFVYQAMIRLIGKMQTHFKVTSILICDSVLVADTEDNSCRIFADISVHQPGIHMGIALKKKTVSALHLVNGSGDVKITADDINNEYFIESSNYMVTVGKVMTKTSNIETTQLNSLVGVPISNYSIDHLSKLIGRQTESIWLLGFNGQVEQVQVRNSNPYTLKVGEKDQLIALHPDFYVESKHAFKFFPRKQQTIELGKIHDQYFVKVVNHSVAVGVDLVVLEAVTMSSYPLT